LRIFLKQRSFNAQTLRVTLKLCNSDWAKKKLERRGYLAEKSLISLTVSIQYTNVTDGQTPADDQYRAYA